MFEDYGKYTSDQQYEIDDEGTIKEPNKTESKTGLLILTFFIILLMGPASAVLIRF